MSHNLVARLSVYALLSGIEEDLRDAIDAYLLIQLSPAELLGADRLARASQRLEDELGLPSTAAEPVDFLKYLDLGDLCPLLNEHKDLLPADIGRYFQQITKSIDLINPIRNRIAHQRPLHPEDFATTLDTANGLCAGGASHWFNLGSILTRLTQDAGFVLSLKIPTYNSASGVRHNLPLPDFDETGFLGRRALLTKLNSLLRGAYPVITLFGDGGVGKTALALKVVYDILDDADCPFSAIVWTTAKSAQVTGTEIRRIANSVSDSLGMLEDIASTAGVHDGSNPIGSLLTYLRRFRVLLIMDNMETIVDDRIKALLQELGDMPPGSKVLITSRFSIGYDYPLKVDSMDPLESVNLLRALAKMRGVEQLSQISNRQIEPFCKRLFHNPLHIKWFVSAVQSGISPEQVLSETKPLLEYCQSNVFDHLTSNSKTIVRSLLVGTDPISAAEIAFFTRLGPLEVQHALVQLMTTSMIAMHSKPRGASYETRYALGDVARKYLATHQKLDADEHKRLLEMRKKLVFTKEAAALESNYNRYSALYIEQSTKSDFVVASYLTDALKHSKTRRFEDALVLIEKARLLAPGYYEVYRVEGWVKNAQGDVAGALSAYEAAIEIEPESPRLRLFFAQFLLRALSDEAGALVHLNIAAGLDPNVIEIQTEMARCYLVSSEFEQARASLRDVLTSCDSTEWSRRKAYDTFLQTYEREAEQLAYRQSPSEAIRALKQLKDCFQTVPQELIDEKMKEVLTKAANVAQMLTRNEAERRDAKELQAWYIANCPALNSVSEKGTERQNGTVVWCSDEKRCGSILGEDGTTYFFRGDVRMPEEEWQRILSLCLVSFAASVNQRGPIAKAVRAN